MQYDVNEVNDVEIYYTPYFYIADRLGSVRLAVDANGNAVNSYTYNPFGEGLAGHCVEDANVVNPFKFTGQWFDWEIGQYYLRARMYEPQLMRFTSYDPVKGKFKNPMTLHPYLYCVNDSVNKIDPSGKFGALDAILTGTAVYNHGLNLATYAAHSGDWKFFDISESTFKFMPVAMALATTTSRTVWSLITGVTVGGVIEEATNITGMSRFEGALMNPFAYLAYASYMMKARFETSVFGEIEDFTEWRGDWW